VAKEELDMLLQISLYLIEDKPVVAKEELDMLLQVSLYLVEDKGTCSGQGRKNWTC
jgi:hypothetical protein